MPKPLSLKKVSSNQKAITQFFKTSESEKLRSTQVTSNPSTTLKRKAVSPVQGDEVQIVDEYIRSNDEKSSVEKPPKKQKSEMPPLSNGASKSLEEPKKSTHKENSTKNRQCSINDKPMNTKENHDKGTFIDKNATNESFSSVKKEHSAHNSNEFNLIQAVVVEIEEKKENGISPQSVSKNNSPLKDCNEKSCSPIKLKDCNEKSCSLIKRKDCNEKSCRSIKLKDCNEKSCSLIKRTDCNEKSCSPIKLKDNEKSCSPTKLQDCNGKSCSSIRLKDCNEKSCSPINLKECNEKSCGPIKLSLTPKKGPSAHTELRRSPRINKSMTPEKLAQLQMKTSSAKGALDLDHNVEDMFSEEWDTADTDKKIHEGGIFHINTLVPSSNGDKSSGNLLVGQKPLTPKKSALVKTQLRRSPRIAKQKTPDKLTQSPRKAKVALDFGYNVEDMFGEDWDTTDFDVECKEDLDLSSLQRCEVMSIEHQASNSIVILKNSENQCATCSIEGIWRDTPLSVGETVSVSASRDSTGRFAVTNTSGAVVLRPDHLMSTTSVVAGVFCRRKAVLQERFKGIDGGNHAMTIGILVHELVQTALLNRIADPARLRQEADKLINHSTQMLYDAGLSVEETRASMEVYIAPLVEFMVTYVTDKPQLSGQKNKWQGHIDEILDIEENVCCPQLGLKGKIDATVQVTIHDRKERAVVPLELKTGRASGSAEHRGQIVLYNMMMSVQQDSRLAARQQSGLLLYLKEKADLREVTSGHPERRDLLMLRNELVQYLADGPGSPDPENLTDIEEASHQLRQRLPEPVHHETACSKCPYLTLCCLHLWHTEGPQVSSSHPLAKLRDQALGHLSLEHITYFLHWSALLRAEERAQATTTPLRALWTDPPEARSKRGTCAANLLLRCVQASSDRFLHIFERESSSKDQKDNENTDRKLEEGGPQEGEFSIVSVKGRPWVAAGVISVVKGREIHIMLERDLGRRLPKGTLFHIDQYQSFATTVQNLTNLGVLMEDSDRAERLRKLIIDRQRPEFDAKLPREVGRLGAKIMKSLNLQQQRAVLKAVAARDFSLLQGLPGTGKTQTISAMIQLLAALGRRVLVTAHTHSAVDTVLARLPKSLRIMRLGSGARVAPSLQGRCESTLTALCSTPQELQNLYESMEVVGVTCLGAGHAMLARTVFDVCIVDEATQVLQCTVLRPLLAAKRFVLVGDPDQLPPVVRSRAARRLGMEASLFHHLQTEEATCELRLQYRMNRRLARLANDAAYQGRLQCASDQVAGAQLQIDFTKISQAYGPSSWVTAACSPDMDHAALFVDMGGRHQVANLKGRTCANAAEACIVLALVDALTMGGVAPASIGVVAPYREQVALLRRALARAQAPPEASTVDQFQGRDKCVILYSCTRSGEDNDEAAKEGEILNDQRRLAVSVTRAKHKFIAIGHARALCKYAPLQRMIDACAPLPLSAVDRDALLEKYGRFVYCNGD